MIDTKDDRPRALRRLPGVCFLAALAAGLVISLIHGAVFSAPAQADLLRGEWTAAYQKAYEQGLAVREPALALWAALRYALFSEGEQGVLVGEDGWLYSTEEFVAMDPTGGTLGEAVEYVGAVEDQLLAKNIALVVALVPTKAGTYVEHLGRYHLPPALAHRYETARSALISRGIDAPDLATALREARTRRDVFLRTDTHWTAFGASVAAAALAPSVRRQLDERRSPREEYAQERLGWSERAGDLLSFIPLGPFHKATGLRPDLVETTSTSARAESAAELFSELQIPVALVGTSYSAAGAWNFDGALKAAVQADVLKVAVEGQGPFVPMQRYLESQAIDDPRPDVVIWEIPERYLGVRVALGISSLHSVN
jgi:alginate O-acetyltransferase complex protein AlgJ